MSEYLKKYGIERKGKTPTIILAIHNETKEC